MGTDIVGLLALAAFACGRNEITATPTSGGGNGQVAAGAATPGTPTGAEDSKTFAGSSESDARAVVSAYLDDVKEGNFNTAFARLCPSLIRETSVSPRSLREDRSADAFLWGDITGYVIASSSGNAVTVQISYGGAYAVDPSTQVRTYPSAPATVPPAWMTRRHRGFRACLDPGREAALRWWVLGLGGHGGPVRRPGSAPAFWRYYVL